MTVTIKIATASGGVAYSGESDTYGGDLTDAHSSSYNYVTYTYTLRTSSIPANFDGSVTASFTSGSTHSAANDTWSVVSTSDGVTATISGQF